MTVLEALKFFGLQRTYSQEELKIVYRNLARKYHPDIAGSKYTSHFARINEAYSILSKSNIGSSLGVLTHKTIFDVERYR